MTQLTRRAFAALFLFFALLTSSAEELSELSSYQEVDRLWIGLGEGSLEPKAIEAIQASIEGYYLFEARDGDRLRKGQFWLTIDPSKLELEKQELALEEKKLKEAERKAQLDETEELLALEAKLEEVEEQRRLLLETSSVEEAAELLDAGLIERVQRGVTKLDEEIERLRSLMDPETRQTAKELTKKEQALQIERKRLALIITEKRSKIKANFEGMLTLSTEVKERLLEDSEGLVWLSPGAAIGLIANRDTYVVRIPSEGTLLDTVPQDKARIMIRNQEEGKLIMADLLQVNQEQTGAQSQDVFEFEISKEDAKSLSTVNQKKIVAHLFRTFEKPCRMIPKRDIAFEDSTTLQSGGWKLLVQKLYPEVELVAIGPQHLAVRKKE